MVLAANESEYQTYAMISEVFNTFRLLIDSMDFLDEDGDGWEVLDTLCRSSYILYDNEETKIPLILWMLKFLSFELKTHAVRRNYASMLNWILVPNPALEEAADLLLNLGGVEVIDEAIYDTGGYNVLHELTMYTFPNEISTVLSKGPDLHRLGFDYNLTPQEETPTSLAMYSSWIFKYWLDGLISIEMDIEKFVEEELVRNHAVHAGWEKETLLDLFTYDYKHSVDLLEAWTYKDCSDCAKRHRGVEVQPYWRHLLERIKQRLDPDTPAQDDSEVREKENADLGSIAEAASSSSDLAHKPDVVGDIPLVDLSKFPSESESEPESGEDPHGYPATISIRSDCVYAKHEMICMDCWLYYIQTGTRRPLGPFKRRFVVRPDADDPPLEEYSSPRVEPSEEEYSPYHIHS